LQVAPTAPNCFMTAALSPASVISASLALSASNFWALAVKSGKFCQISAFASVFEAFAPDLDRIVGGLAGGGHGDAAHQNRHGGQCVDHQAGFAHYGNSPRI
jgi:hypothetical protein